MFNIGSAELILILLIAFVIVGPKDLPKVAHTLGRFFRQMRDMFDEFKDETGLDETFDELKATEDDLNKTMREVDPTRDLRDAKTEANKAILDAKKAVKKDLPKLKK